MQSCVTPKKQMYSVESTTTPSCLTPLNTTRPIVPVELHKTKQLPPDSKYYLCSQINSKPPNSAQCVKSRILNKVNNSIPYIDTFEKQRVEIKPMLQSLCLEYHMKTVAINQSICTSSYLEHKYMNNIENIYQHVGKCDDQQNLKDILDAAMVSTREGVTYNSPNVPLT